MLYLTTPVLVLLVWVGHAALSWRRPGTRDPFGLLLLVGLPLALVVAVVVFGVAADPALGQHDALPRGDHGDLRVRALVVGVEVLLAGLVVLALEAVLSAVRHRRSRVVM